MADWVSKHDAIVVCVDGYVASDYTGFYGGSPWDLMESGGDHDFGPYFLELLNHIDADAPRLLPLPKSDRLLLPPGREVHLPVCIHQSARGGANGCYRGALFGLPDRHFSFEFGSHPAD